MGNIGNLIILVENTIFKGLSYLDEKNNQNILFFPENALKNKKIQDKLYKAFSHHGHLKYFNKDEIVFQLGDFSKETFFIENGNVRLFTSTSDGKEVTLHIRNSGDCFGIIESILNWPRVRYAETIYKKAAIWVMEGNVLNNLITKDNEIIYYFFCQAAQHSMRYQKILGELAILSAEKRVIKLLIRLSEEHGREKGNSIIIDSPFTHEELAKMVGISRQRITVILNDLQKQGFLRLKYKKIIILDMKSLIETSKSP